MSDNTAPHADDGRSSPASNILLLEPATGGTADGTCVDLLCGAHPDDVDVLFATVTDSPGDRLDAWRAHAAGPPASMGFVSVADRARSAAAAGSGTPDLGHAGPVRTVSDPSDLTGVGIAITETLSSWADDGNRTVVCLESLTALLQYSDVERVYRFLNVLTSQFARAGVVAHVHATPESHDEQTLGTLASLFDEVRCDDDAGAGGDASATDAPSVSPTDADDGASAATAAEASGFVFPAAEASTPGTAAPDAPPASADGAVDAPAASEPAEAGQSSRSDAAAPPEPSGAEGRADVGTPDATADVAAARPAVEPAIVPIAGDGGAGAPVPADAETDLVVRETAATPVIDPSVADSPVADSSVADWRLGDRVSPRLVVGIVGVLFLIGVVGGLLGGVPIDDGRIIGGGQGGDAPAEDPAAAGAGAAATNTSTATVTASRTVTATATATPTPSPSPSPTATATAVPTATASATPAPTATATATPDDSLLETPTILPSGDDGLVDDDDGDLL